MTMPQFNLLSFKPVVPLFSIYYSFLKKKAPQFGHKKTLGSYIYQCAGKHTFATPKPNPNPPKTKLIPKKTVQKSQKLKKQGVLTVNIIPREKWDHRFER